jgi:hypothetical protein
MCCLYIRAMYGSSDDNRLRLGQTWPWVKKDISRAFNRG